MGAQDVPLEDKMVTIAHSSSDMVNINYINFAATSVESAKVSRDTWLFYLYLCLTHSAQFQHYEYIGNSQGHNTWILI